jgi:hypothetical protein
MSCDSLTLTIMEEITFSSFAKHGDVGCGEHVYSHT